MKSMSMDNFYHRPEQWFPVTLIESFMWYSWFGCAQAQHHALLSDRPLIWKKNWAIKPSLRPKATRFGELLVRQLWKIKSNSMLHIKFVPLAAYWQHCKWLLKQLIELDDFRARFAFNYECFVQLREKLIIFGNCMCAQKCLIVKLVHLRRNNPNRKKRHFFIFCYLWSCEN